MGWLQLSGHVVSTSSLVIASVLDDALLHGGICCGHDVRDALLYIPSKLIQSYDPHFHRVGWK
jgi:hypothetical protein